MRGGELAQHTVLSRLLLDTATAVSEEMRSIFEPQGGCSAEHCSGPQGGRSAEHCSGPRPLSRTILS